MMKNDDFYGLKIVKINAGCFGMGCAVFFTFSQMCQAGLILLPPAQYDHEPTIPVIEQILSWEDVQRVCHAQERFAELKRPLSAGSGMLGCSLVKDGKCYIVYTGALNVRRHEIAHCNGWPGNHPGGWNSLTP